MTVEATNIGAGELPFGYGAHPYLTVGEATVDEVAVTVPAASYLEVDDRLLPTKISPVDGTVYDLRRGPVLGSVSLDTAMTDLCPRSRRALAGEARARRPLRRVVGRRDDAMGADLHRRAEP